MDFTVFFQTLILYGIDDKIINYNYTFKLTSSHTK